jgi:peptidoglycan/LPS O-acetylase OafA/YrhL
MEMTTPQAARLAPLDTLRAFAVLLVLGRHMPDLPAGSAPAWLLSFAAVWKRGGWIGVDLFFVLSGFLISGLLFREYQRFGEIRYGHFLARRGFKIYPAFYLMMVIVVWVSSALGKPWPGWNVLFSEACFVQNYGPALFPHTWSLAVEEHFYLLLPLLLLSIRGRGAGAFAWLPRVFCAVAVLVFVARIVTTEFLPVRLKTHYFPTHLRIDSLLFGVLLSYFAHFHSEMLARNLRKFCWPLAGLAMVLALPPFFLEIGQASYLHTFGFTGLYLSGGILLALACEFRLSIRPLAWLGLYSYSIYLWHIPVRFIGVPLAFPNASPVWATAAYFIGSVGIGLAAACLIEQPFLALRDRLFPTRSQAPAGTRGIQP